MRYFVQQQKGEAAASANTGLWAAIGAFTLWGILPLYWKLLEPFPAFEILCQRVAWSFVFMVPLTLCTGRMGEVLRALGCWRTLRVFILSSLILASNWFIFIWAVNHGRVLETSLGYYITPLLSVCLGVVFFNDRPRPVQWLAIALALCGVAAQVALLGKVPLTALGLGVTFAAYGALRKTAPMESLPGLALETIVLFPLALGFLIRGELAGAAVFFRSPPDLQISRALSGVITTVPLVWFAYGARRLTLVTLGLLQYIGPSLSFLLGVFVFHERFTAAHALSFGCIWLALALYTADSAWAHRAPAPKR